MTVQHNLLDASVNDASWQSPAWSLERHESWADGPSAFRSGSPGRSLRPWWHGCKMLQ